MYVAFVLVFRPCFEKFSLGTPVFSSLQKPTLPNANNYYDLESEGHRFVSRNRPLSVTLINPIRTGIFKLASAGDGNLTWN